MVINKEEIEKLSIKKISYLDKYYISSTGRIFSCKNYKVRGEVWVNKLFTKIYKYL